MIPKKIHYCWFGGKPLPQLAIKCIESWKKYCPDYEIIEWNENNFNIHSNKYVEEAYEAKKWAFVTDYVRLYVLKKYGGIYMDTDVEVIKPLDYFLIHKAFSGFETKYTIPTGIMASEKNGEWISYLLTYYNEAHFIINNGSMNLTTNVTTITKMTKHKYAINLDGTLQQTDGDVVFYPKDYFCPKSYETGKINLTRNTHTIHHFAGSWVPKSEKIKNKISEIIGPNMTSKIVGLKKKLRK